VHHATPGEVTKPRRKGFKLTPGMTVKEFAELIGQRPADIMRKLMDMGQMLTFNQTMNVDAAVIIAEENGVKIDVSTEKAGEELLESVVQTEEEAQLEPRPRSSRCGPCRCGRPRCLMPSGKRKWQKAAGGITQHIAYTVALRETGDVPGHAWPRPSPPCEVGARSPISSSWSWQQTWVIPQTIEAINRQSRIVPIIVAINKIASRANSDRVVCLSEHGLISESWEVTIMVESRPKSTGHLLEAFSCNRRC
jgi:translation initiation factor IF-2